MDLTATMMVSGNLVRDPRVNTTKDGVTVASLRIASTPRRFERETGQWRDGEPVFVTVTCWRQLARNVFASLQKGDPVFAFGRVVNHSWEREGERRSEMEIEASVVGPDVGRTVVEVIRRRRDGAGGPAAPATDAATATDLAAEPGTGTVADTFAETTAETSAELDDPAGATVEERAVPVQAAPAA